MLNYRYLISWRREKTFLGGWVAGSPENKASSAPIELGLGLSLAIFIKLPDKKKTCCCTWPNLQLRTCKNSQKNELQVGPSAAKCCKVVFSFIRKFDEYINFVIVSNLYSDSHSTHFDMCMMNNRTLFVFSNTT